MGQNYLNNSCVDGTQRGCDCADGGSIGSTIGSSCGHMAKSRIRNGDIESLDQV